MKGLCSVIKVRLLRSPQINQVDPKPKDKRPYKKREKRGQGHRGEGHVKTEAETGVRLPQAKERQEQEKAKTDSSLETLEATLSCPHLDLGLLDSRVVREYSLLLFLLIFFVFILFYCIYFIIVQLQLSAFAPLHSPLSSLLF